jgi:deoxyribodipyrimidine photo-lyase
LFEGNSVNILQEVTRQLIQLGHKPKLYFNRDVQVEYGIERDNALINFYTQLNLDYHLGLNNFLQLEDNREHWVNEYYTYVRQFTNPTPTSITTPELSLNLPQLTFAELKRKYSTFYETGRVYFKGGETQAQKTLNSFLTKRFHGYHWKIQCRNCSYN